MRFGSLLLTFVLHITTYKSATAGISDYIRISDGYSLWSDDISGRVEVFIDNRWGTVCDDNFGLDEANLVCQLLGYPSGGIPLCCAHFYQGYGPIYNGSIDCLPHTTNYSECLSPGWGVNNCTHSQDVGVRCGAQFEIDRTTSSSDRTTSSSEHARSSSTDRTTSSSDRARSSSTDRTTSSSEHARSSSTVLERRPGLTCGVRGGEAHLVWNYDDSADTVNVIRWYDGTEATGASMGTYVTVPGTFTPLGSYTGKISFTSPVYTAGFKGAKLTFYGLEASDAGNYTTVFQASVDSVDTAVLEVAERDGMCTWEICIDGSYEAISDLLPLSSSADVKVKFTKNGALTCDMDIDMVPSVGDSFVLVVAAGPGATAEHTLADLATLLAAGSLSIDLVFGNNGEVFHTDTINLTSISVTSDRTRSASGATTNSPAGRDGCDYGSAICEHICTPIAYSMNFTCSCESGFGLKADGVSCRGRCPAGTYVTGDTCIPCPHGQYQQYQEKPQCDPCPNGYNTSDTGSTSSSQCRPLCALALGRCENGGRCVDDGGLPSCDCRETGFTGQTCVIDIDECLPKPCKHGGQCTNTPGGYECECPTEERTTYAGANYTEVVTETKTPVTSSAFPLYGPLAGGTNITIYGKNFDHGFRPVRLLLDKTSNCPVWQSNGTYLVATTPAGQDLYVDAQLPIDVVFEGGLTISTGKSFVYRGNPEITALYPNNTLLEGGSTITVNGKRLTSVDTPYIEITMELTIRTYHETFDVISEIIKDVFAEKCDVLTDEMAECRTPVIRLPPTYNASDDKSTLLLYIGFVLDGFDDYRNLENTSLDSSRTLGYVATHNMEPLLEVFLYNGGSLRLKGAHIDDGDDAKYSVLIGQGDCPITDRTSTLIECTVPSRPPPKLPHSTSKHHRITLNILRSVNYTMGEVQYPPERDLVIGLAVGAAAILAAFAIVVIVVIVKKRRSGKDSGSKMDDGVVLPALPTNNGDYATISGI